MPISRLIFKEDQDIFYLLRKQLFETRNPQTCDLRMMKINGTAFWARVEITVAQDESGASVSA